MSGTLQVDKLQTKTGGPAELIGQRASKAVCHFDGSTSSVDRSLNISTMTDNGVGDYTFNFTNAMLAADYIVSGSSENPTAGSAGPSGFITLGAQLVGSTQLNTTQVGGTLANLYDPTFAGFTVEGDLA